MTRSELIAELASANPHLRAQDVELIVGTVFDEISAALARGLRFGSRGPEFISEFETKQGQ